MQVLDCQEPSLNCFTHHVGAPQFCSGSRVDCFYTFGRSLTWISVKLPQFFLVRAVWHNPFTRCTQRWASLEVQPDVIDTKYVEGYRYRSIKICCVLNVNHVIGRVYVAYQFYEVSQTHPVNLGDARRKYCLLEVFSTPSCWHLSLTRMTCYILHMNCNCSFKLCWKVKSSCCEGKYTKMAYGVWVSSNLIFNWF